MSASCCTATVQTTSFLTAIIVFAPFFCVCACFLPPQRPPAASGDVRAAPWSSAPVLPHFIAEVTAFACAGGSFAVRCSPIVPFLAGAGVFPGVPPPAGMYVYCCPFCAAGDAAGRLGGGYCADCCLASMFPVFACCIWGSTRYVKLALAGPAPRLAAAPHDWRRRSGHVTCCLLSAPRPPWFPAAVGRAFFCAVAA